ncbi:hypothetical protein N752_00750 [Desulforamulus aquiferis]|nr:HAD hydrolase family protein [Desulforamulus aquiferis]RYD07144.1 hypothetical protein N752_00750 [Desulforamulus aquiferis]
MSKYRMLAIDLDDTLLNSKLQISPLSREYIDRAREAGVHVTLATGRMFRSASLCQGIGIGPALDYLSGALVKETISEEVLLHRPVPLDLAREAIKWIKELKLHINVYVEDNLYVERVTPEAERYYQISGVPIHRWEIY